MAACLYAQLPLIRSTLIPQFRIVARQTPQDCHEDLTCRRLWRLWSTGYLIHAHVDSRPIQLPGTNVPVRCFFYKGPQKGGGGER
jgi:hypothetical protein